MDERLASILEAAIEGFINTGEPVSSGWLYKQHNFGIKPAMIRLELEKLSDEGFLEQPYHSAGRTPSDKGYEFFAERARDTKTAEREGSFYKNFRSLLARQAFAELAGELSEELGLLGVAEDVERGTLHKHGLNNLVENLAWDNDEDIKSVIRDFEEIDERLTRIKGKLAAWNGGPQVFIGKKSPITRSASLSVVMGNYEMDGDRVLLLAIGPKRMDYKKTLRIFKNL